MRRKKRNPITKRREREFSDVNCPDQQKTYCSTYHLIDKGNGAEAKYDISTESHLHGWGPKLAARYFNMNANNAYKIYVCLYKKHDPGREPMELRHCITNLTHSLLQQGPEMRVRSSGPPPNAVKNLGTSTSGDGRKIRWDSKWQPWASPTGSQGTGEVQSGSPQTPVSSLTARGLYYQRAAFSRLKNDQPGRNHLPVPVIVSSSGRDCKYQKCPGWNTNSKRPRSYATKYKCE
jgi:hypothetical protein